MLINDLSYLEEIAENNTISGGVLVGVTADALALGDPSATLTDTTATVRMLGNGGSMGKGHGIAVAIGDDVSAGVNLIGVGDSVKMKIKEKYFPNKDMLVVRGFVMVKDKP
ncbi:hypothetical protein H6F89_19930 [Cyanobacteria bacterium FACHB-63]|nr:hypothetical protein [Cyanobacteria bacterium FACHB-63]